MASLRAQITNINQIRTSFQQVGTKSTGRVGLTNRAYEGKSIQDSPIQLLPRQDIRSAQASIQQRPGTELQAVLCSALQIEGNIAVVWRDTHILCIGSQRLLALLHATELRSVLDSTSNSRKFLLLA